MLSSRFVRKPDTNELSPWFCQISELGSEKVYISGMVSITLEKAYHVSALPIRQYC
jgi:hypothetical protein